MVLPSQTLVKTFSLKLSDALNRKLDIVVSQRKTTKSRVLRDALEAHLADEGRAQKGTVAEVIHDLIGIYDGPKDLSTNPRHFKCFGK
jgi:predicted transcriptional regulator